MAIVCEWKKERKNDTKHFVEKEETGATNDWNGIAHTVWWYY